VLAVLICVVDVPASSSVSLVSVILERMHAARLAEIRDPALARALLRVIHS
jgi:hypothetical protein